MYRRRTQQKHNKYCVESRASVRPAIFYFVLVIHIVLCFFRRSSPWVTDYTFKNNRLNNLLLRIARVLIVYSVTSLIVQRVYHQHYLLKAELVDHPWISSITAYLTFNYIETQQNKFFFEGWCWMGGWN